MTTASLPTRRWSHRIAVALVLVLVGCGVLVLGHLVWHRSQIGLDHRQAPLLILPNQPLSEGPYYLEKLTSPAGFDRIVCLNHWVGGKVLASQQSGRLWLIDPQNPSAARVVLDLTPKTFSGGESGLFGVTAHPRFDQAGAPGYRQLFAFYCAVKGPGRNSNRLSRFTWDDQRNAVDPASELILIDQDDEDSWHNGGAVAFGGDGFLYLTLGDEGQPDDVLQNSQRIDRDLFSGVLRIDVDRQGGTISHPITKKPATGTTDHYFLPNDNPWVGTPDALEEFYALGLRSPHNLFIDPQTKDLYVTDVGQNLREELNHLGKGANFGWSWMEGDISFGKSRFGGQRPSSLLGQYRAPLLAYPHNNGNTCIIGGTVYRGQKFAALHGKLLIGDLGSGRIWSVAITPGQPLKQELIATVESKQSRSLVSIATAGEDVMAVTLTGELFLLRQRAAVDRSNLLPQKLSDTKLFTDLTSLTPATGVIPYDVNSPLWSDGAQKQRWLAIPGDGTATKASDDRIIVAKDGTWAFPIGSTFIKHFSLPTDVRDPKILRRLETRIIVRETGGGIWGVTYRWNETGDEAFLLPADGLTEEIAIRNAAGTEEKITWTYPSRDDCLTCHNSSTGGILGLSTAQMNRSIIYPSTGRTGNQLRTLNEIGYLSRDRGRANPIRVHRLLMQDRMVSPSDTTASLDERATAYLAANCSHCHRPGYLRIDMDLRHGVPLKDRAVIDTKTEVPTAKIQSRRIDLSDPEHSELYHRMTRLEPGIRMPLIGSHRVDEAGARLVLEWIKQLGFETEAHTAVAKP